MRVSRTALAAAFACTMSLLTFAPFAAADEVSRTTLVRERILIIQGYIEHYAADHGGAYPLPPLVCVGGGLEAPIWPSDPWTGQSMQPGASPGDYSYVLSPDGRSYTLIGHLRRGNFGLRGGGATSLDAERDARAAEAVELLRQYVLDYARENNFSRPPAGQVSSTGAVGTGLEAGAWPGTRGQERQWRRAPGWATSPIAPIPTGITSRWRSRRRPARSP